LTRKNSTGVIENREYIHPLDYDLNFLKFSLKQNKKGKGRILYNVVSMEPHLKHHLPSKIVVK